METGWRPSTATSRGWRARSPPASTRLVPLQRAAGQGRPAAGAAPAPSSRRRRTPAGPAMMSCSRSWPRPRTASSNWRSTSARSTRKRQEVNAELRSLQIPPVQHPEHQPAAAGPAVLGPRPRHRRPALRRRAHPGPGRGQQVGGRGRAGPAQLRPVAAGPVPALRPGGGLGGRAPPRRPAGLLPGAGPASPPPRRPDRHGGRPLLLDMLEIKPDSGFDAWLQAELARRANHACVESVAEFRTAAKAVTRAGQIKDRERHEKDDRRRIGDRREYVLGWSNEQKIEAMIAHAAALQSRQTKLAEGLQAEKGRRRVGERLQSLARLDEYPSWDDLDWEALVNQIAAAARRTGPDPVRFRPAGGAERRALAGGRIHPRQGETRSSLLQHERGGLEHERDAAARSRRAGRADPRRRGAAEIEPATEAGDGGRGVRRCSTAGSSEVPGLVAGRAGQPGRYSTATGSGPCNARTPSASGPSEPCPTSVPSTRRRRSTSTRRSTSAGEYRELHQRVAEDDLPRFEKEFKDYLNQNTIRDIASFAAQLNKQEKLIRERIDTINRSLVDIDYNEGRYITLVAEPTPNVDVREFRQELRACTDDVIGAGQSDQYSEQKFLQVKRIIDRFKGREGFTDIDRNWTRRVTDVRQWFLFSASERWREDDTEYEHYTDSAGKSGGQKEKLAYTILAASLAYQFKLDWGAARSKAFRFVVIDEAFGRGSERFDSVRADAVHPARTAAPDRHTIAEDPRDRAVRVGGRVRRQPDRELLQAASAHHRRVQAAPAAAPGHGVRGAIGRVKRAGPTPLASGPAGRRRPTWSPSSAGAGTPGGTSRPTPAATSGNRSCCRSRGRTPTNCCTASRRCASGRPTSKPGSTGPSRSSTGRSVAATSGPTGYRPGCGSPTFAGPVLAAPDYRGGSGPGAADAFDGRSTSGADGLGGSASAGVVRAPGRLGPGAGDSRVDRRATTPRPCTCARSTSKGWTPSSWSATRSCSPSCCLWCCRRSGSTCLRSSSPGASVS